MSAVPVLGTNIPAPQKPTDRSKTNLIVNYLPQDMNEMEVKTLFSSFGHVESCKLIRDKTTQVSLGYAFVNYDSAESAAKGIQGLNGHVINSKTIKVSYARPSSVEIKNANLYIAQLPKAYTQAELDTLFSSYGNIITSKILADETGVSRGAGFVRFDKHSEAERARMALDGVTIPGHSQPLIVKYANQKVPMAAMPPLPRPQQQIGPMKTQPISWRFNPMGITPSRPGQLYCIYIYNMPEDGNDNTLYQLFSPYGAIANVKVIIDYNTKKCKGYGFVNMLSYEEAYRAIIGLNGTTFQGRRLQVSFKTPNYGYQYIILLLLFVAW